jgi:predicted Zn-dependent protease
MIVRLLLIAVALTAGAWLAVQERAARADDALTRLIFENKARSPEAERLLDRARTLNPDRRPDLLEAVMRGRRGDLRGAVAILERVTRAEPENVEAWASLASAAARVDPALARRARARVRALSPPVR